MRDLNFFSPYIQVKKASRKKDLFIAGTAILAAIVVISFSVWNVLEIKRLQADIEKYEGLLNSNAIAKKLQDTNTKRDHIKIFKEYESLLQKINLQIDYADQINRQFFDDIAMEIPQEMFLINIVISSEEMNLHGTASNRIPIAELVHNLKQLPYFSKVHVNVIAEDGQEDHSIFNIKCTFKDVATNE